MLPGGEQVEQPTATGVDRYGVPEEQYREFADAHEFDIRGWAGYPVLREIRADLRGWADRPP
jgi:hypothetical protein